MLASADNGCDVIIRSVKDLGAAVRQRRKALNLDQASLAAQVGVTRQWIGGLERGKAGVELALVLRTLKALNMPLSLGDPLTDPTTSSPSVDIDAIVAKARGDG